MKQLTTLQVTIGTVVISLVLFYPFLGAVHLFDWDEINFAEAAREMIATGNYSMVQINYEPFWEKPPLFFWMQVISMKLFGVNEFAARFTNALCGTLSLLLFTQIGRRLHNLRVGVLWAALYTASLLPQLYFKSGIIDPWFNLFIFSGIYFAHEYLRSYQAKNEQLKYIALAGASIGLGVMTKGPVALLIFMMVAGIFWATQRFKMIFSWKAILSFLLCFILLGTAWFVVEIASGRYYIVEDFVMYQIRLLQTQDAGHGGPFFYHWYVLLIGCFPLSILALGNLFRWKSSESSKGQFHQIMLILFWSVLLLFSLVKTKIIHYSSLCYFPMSYLAAIYLESIMDDKPKPWLKISLGVLGSIMLLILFLAPLIGSHLHWILDSGLMNDPFAEANMQAEVDWSLLDYLPAVIMATGLLGFFIYQNQKKWMTLLSASALAFTAMGVLIVPKVELISQNAAIEFYESKQGVDCYVDTYGYFSYADLFYTRKLPQSNPLHSNKEFLMTGAVEKPVFMVSKITKKEEFLTKYPNFKLLYEKNGFVFYQRVDS